MTQAIKLIHTSVVSFFLYICDIPQDATADFLYMSKLEKIKSIMPFRGEIERKKNLSQSVNVNM